MSAYTRGKTTQPSSTPTRHLQDPHHNNLWISRKSNTRQDSIEGSFSVNNSNHQNAFGKPLFWIKYYIFFLRSQFISVAFYEDVL